MNPPPHTTHILPSPLFVEIPAMDDHSYLFAVTGPEVRFGDYKLSCAHPAKPLQRCSPVPSPGWTLLALNKTPAKGIATFATEKFKIDFQHRGEKESGVATTTAVAAATATAAVAAAIPSTVPPGRAHGSDAHSPPLPPPPPGVGTAWAAYNAARWSACENTGLSLNAYLTMIRTLRTAVTATTNAVRPGSLTGDIPMPTHTPTPTSISTPIGMHKLELHPPVDPFPEWGLLAPEDLDWPHGCAWLQGVTHGVICVNSFGFEEAMATTAAATTSLLKGAQALFGGLPASLPWPVSLETAWKCPTTPRGWSGAPGQPWGLEPGLALGPVSRLGSGLLALGSLPTVTHFTRAVAHFKLALGLLETKGPCGANEAWGDASPRCKSILVGLSRGLGALSAALKLVVGPLQGMPDATLADDMFLCALGHRPWADAPVPPETLEAFVTGAQTALDVTVFALQHLDKVLELIMLDHSATHLGGVGADPGFDGYSMTFPSSVPTDTAPFNASAENPGKDDTHAPVPVGVVSPSLAAIQLLEAKRRKAANAIVPGTSAEPATFASTPSVGGAGDKPSIHPFGAAAASGDDTKDRRDGAGLGASPVPGQLRDWVWALTNIGINVGQALAMGLSMPLVALQPDAALPSAAVALFDVGTSRMLCALALSMWLDEFPGEVTTRQILKLPVAAAAGARVWANGILKATEAMEGLDEFHASALVPDGGRAADDGTGTEPEPEPEPEPGTGSLLHNDLVPRVQFLGGMLPELGSELGGLRKDEGGTDGGPFRKFKWAFWGTTGSSDTQRLNAEVATELAAATPAIETTLTELLAAGLALGVGGDVTFSGTPVQ